MKNIKAFMHHAMKSDKYQWDYPEKHKLLAAFNFLKVQAVTPVNALFFNKVTNALEVPDFDIYMSPQEVAEDFDIFVPDFIILGKYPPEVVEIDGDVHWKNGKSVKRTNLRNELYEENRIKMYWFTKKQVFDMSLEELCMEIKDKQKDQNNRYFFLP